MHKNLTLQLLFMAIGILVVTALDTLALSTPLALELRGQSALASFIELAAVAVG